MANLNFLKKALPFLGTAVQLALPGPIGIAAKILTTVLAPKDPVQPTADSVSTALEAALGDPATAEKAREAERQYQLEMSKMGFQSLADMETVAAQDRASARSREVQVRDKTPMILAYMTVATGLAMSLYLVSPKAVALHDVAAAGFAGTVLGYVIGEAKQVMNYYFGSSSGSAEKTTALAEIAQQK